MARRLAGRADLGATRADHRRRRRTLELGTGRPRPRDRDRPGTRHDDAGSLRRAHRMAGLEPPQRHVGGLPLVPILPGVPGHPARAGHHRRRGRRPGRAWAGRGPPCGDAWAPSRERTISRCSPRCPTTHARARPPLTRGTSAAAAKPKPAHRLAETLMTRQRVPGRLLRGPHDLAPHVLAASSSATASAPRPIIHSRGAPGRNRDIAPASSVRWPSDSREAPSVRRAMDSR